MTRTPDDGAEFAVSIWPSLTRFTWLLTGDDAAAIRLAQTALARTSTRRRSEDDTTAKVRAEAVHAYFQSASSAGVGVVPAGLADLSPRDRAIAVLRHASGLSVPAVAEVARTSEAQVRRVTQETTPAAESWRYLSPPPGLLDLDLVALRQERAQERQRARRRTHLWVGAVLAVLVSLGGLAGWRVNAGPDAVVSRLDLGPELSAPARIVSTLPLGRVLDSQSNIATLTAHLLAGTPQRMMFTLEVPGLPTRTTVGQLPTQPGQLMSGSFVGTPFYVARGNVLAGRVSFGPVVQDVTQLRVEVFDAGGWSLMWPFQPGLTATTRDPVGVLWQADGKRYAQALAGRYPRSQRIALRSGEDNAALVSSDGTSVLIETSQNRSEQPISNGRVLTSLARLPDGAGLSYTAVGYGAVTRVVADPAAGVRVQLVRGPLGPQLYAIVLRPTSPGTALPPTVALTAYDGEQVVGRVTVERAVPAAAVSTS